MVLRKRKHCTKMHVDGDGTDGYAQVLTQLVLFFVGVKSPSRAIQTTKLERVGTTEHSRRNLYGTVQCRRLLKLKLVRTKQEEDSEAMVTALHYQDSTCVRPSSSSCAESWMITVPQRLVAHGGSTI